MSYDCINPDIDSTMMIMLRSLCRAVSRVCYAVGLERMSLRFLLWSLDDTNVELVSVELMNVPQETIPSVVFEDLEAMAELDSEVINTVKYPTTPFDIN